MAYLRQFVPDVLATVRFAGGPGASELLEAVAVLTGLYAARTRKVPPGAPAGFVPARWAGYLDTAAAAGDVTAYRHYWELCVLMGLRDGLRSGDVYVPGSRRYADPASFLLTPPSGRRSGSSSAVWPERPRPPPTPSSWPATSCTPPWLTWKDSWPGAAQARCG